MMTFLGGTNAAPIEVGRICSLCGAFITRGVVLKCTDCGWERYLCGVCAQRQATNGKQFREHLKDLHRAICDGGSSRKV